MAGGGGHTGYAFTLAQELKDRTELVFLVPDDDPLTRMRLEPLGEVRTLVKPRHPRTPFYEFAPRLFLSLVQSLIRVPGDYDVAVCTGSNFCIFPSLVSRLRGMVLINLESADRFTSPSRTAKILRPFANVTALQWEDQKRILKGIVFGPFLPEKRIEPYNGGYVLIACGTYGYEELLDAASDSSMQEVVLQTGPVSPEKYVKKHPNWTAFKTSDEFYRYVAGARVVVAPPGATPLEAVTYGKPVVIVRYPWWSRAGTNEDARLFAEKMNATLLSNISSEALKKAVDDAEKRPRPRLTNGARLMAEYIIRIGSDEQMYY